MALRWLRNYSGFVLLSSQNGAGRSTLLGTSNVGNLSRGAAMRTINKELHWVRNVARRLTRR